jgi:hypothetical protein
MAKREEKENKGQKPEPNEGEPGEVNNSKLLQGCIDMILPATMGNGAFSRCIAQVCVSLLVVLKMPVAGSLAP